MKDLGKIPGFNYGTYLLGQFHQGDTNVEREYRRDFICPICKDKRNSFIIHYQFYYWRQSKFELVRYYKEKSYCNECLQIIKIHIRRSLTKRKKISNG